MSSDYAGALTEELRDQLKLIMEALQALKTVPANIAAIKAELLRINHKDSIFELVIQDQSRLLNNQKNRLTKLEAA